MGPGADVVGCRYWFWQEGERAGDETRPEGEAWIGDGTATEGEAETEKEGGYGEW